MGDAGSLALGGGLATVSIFLHRPWSLLLIGIVFVLETFKCDLTSYFLPNYWKANFQDDTNPSPFRNAWLV